MTTIGLTVVSANVVCVALEVLLTAQMAAALAAQGQAFDPPVELDPVISWKQLPTRQSLSMAVLPVGAISCPGLAGEPTRDEKGNYSATWVLAAAVYARGADYDDTTRRIRAYAAAVRAVGLANPSLGGVAIGVRWTHEEYALLDPRSSRTEAGCLVEFDVDVADVVTTDPEALVVEATGSYGLIPVHPAL